MPVSSRAVNAGWTGAYGISFSSFALEPSVST